MSTHTHNQSKSKNITRISQLIEWDEKINEGNLMSETSMEILQNIRRTEEIQTLSTWRLHFCLETVFSNLFANLIFSITVSRQSSE